MIGAPPVLRRTVGVLVLAAPLLLIFGPFPILRGLVILALGVLAVGLLLLGWLDLSGTLAWRIIFATLAPAAWIAGCQVDQTAAQRWALARRSARSWASICC